MSRLIYKRRVRENDPTMVNAFSSEEIKEYFKDKKEWRIASELYWARHFNRRRGESLRLKLEMHINDYNNLMGRYNNYMNHRYSQKESHP